jgi:hypothetical protein
MEQTIGTDDAAVARVEVEEAKSDDLTVEHGLYLAIGLVAFGLRFIHLGAAPLAPLEAAQTWPAWLAATGTSVGGSPAPTSALFYGLQSLLFFVTGANETLARLLPALAGTAMVLLPWWWRDWLGRGGALVVALLLAVDPWSTALARTADGTGLAIFLGLLTLTALWRWQGHTGSGQHDVATDPHEGVRATRDPDDAGEVASSASVQGMRETGDAVVLAESSAGARMGWERTLAVGLGLLLVSGPQAWSWLPVLAVFGWLYVSGASFVWPRRSSWLWFGAALLLGASGLLARPEAVGAIGTSLTAWLGQWSGDFGAGAEPYRLGSGWPLLRLLVDQALVAVFGMIGVVLLASGRGLPAVQRLEPVSGSPEVMEGRATAARSEARRLALFLGLWLAWGFVLVMLPGRSPFVLPMVGLPLAIATGVAIAYLIALPLGDVTGIEVGVLLGVAAVLVIAAAVWLAMVVESPTYDARLAITAAMLLGLILLIWVVFGFWAGWQAAGKLAGLFFAGLLLLVSVRSGWMLGHLGGQMSPNGFFPVTTLPEARLLPLDVERISSMRNGDPYEAPVAIATAGRPPDPLVGWLLRDMRRPAWVTAPNAGPVTDDESQAVAGASRSPLIVAPFGMEQDRGLAGMVGARYPLTMRWEPGQLPVLPEPDAGSEALPAEELARLRADQAWNQATRPQLEWLLYRTVREAPAVDGVTLWAAP